MIDSQTALPMNADYQDDEINLKELLDTLLQHKWLGLSVFSVVVLLGIFYLFVATPIYKVDALVHVEQQQSMIPGLQDLGNMWAGSRYGYSESQIQIMQSRSVIRRVVSELGLDVQVEPIHFPVIGASLTRRDMGGVLRTMFPDYVWGGESVAVTRFEVAEGLKGVPFLLEAREEGHYALLTAEAAMISEAAVGTPLNAEVDGQAVSVYVRSLAASPGTRFQIINNRVEAVVGNVQGQLAISEQGQFTGVISLVYSGASPERITNILTSLVNNYVRQNVENRSEQASKSLAFLQEQLPGLKQKVADAEAALQSFKSTRGTAVDLSVKGQAILDQASQLETRISELRLERSELRTRFTEQSQAIKTIDQQLGQLTAAKQDIEKELKGMPRTELEIIRLMRDVQVANELYIQLLNKAQEFKVAKAGTIGDARVLDMPVEPWRRSTPQALLVLLLSIILGGMSGIMAILLRRFMASTLETPETIESQLGLSVFATIPHSKTEAARQSKALRNSVNLLSKTEPQDTAVESLRSLRTSLQFALLEAKNNIVSIHGPTPGIGKSFVSANLAFLIGETEKSVLLIDADLRKGHLHKELGRPRSPGLSEVLTGTAEASNVVSRFDGGRVNFLSTGKLPPNPADLLVHERFQALLNQASKTFDLVVIDTPPTLNLADSISIAKLSGVNFLVARGGVNTLQDVRMAHRRMEQNGIRLDGVIFNDLSLLSSRYRYGGYYSYKYRSK